MNEIRLSIIEYCIRIDFLHDPNKLWTLHSPNRIDFLQVMMELTF